ncbi:MAG: transcription elongation factor GreA [Clostridia bacterium]|nr:transcription elongation factor GreA [Clostridia bacterium]
MARAEEMLVTQAGYDKLVAEHEHLTAVRRLEVAERLKEAISYGDLSENAEYDAAKNEQAELEERIMKLEAQIRNAKIIDESEITSDRVNLGHTVKVEYLGTEEFETYKIVGSNEADPLNGLISNESAIGRGLIGAELNSEVEIEIPDGIVHLRVLEISRD